MGQEQDYLMRTVKDITKVIAKIVLGKSDTDYELPAVENYTTEDFLYKRLLELLAEGKINAAENLLFEELDGSNKRKLEVALAFYTKLSEYDKAYLQEHDYTKEEINQGLEDVARKYGIGDLMTYI